MLMVGIMMRDIRTLGQEDGWELTKPDLWTKPKPSEHQEKSKVPDEQTPKNRSWADLDPKVEFARCSPPRFPGQT